jgi:hypothetical protein
MASVALKSVSGDGHTSTLANQIFIFGHGEWDVCDGGHWLDVMKNRWPMSGGGRPALIETNSGRWVRPVFLARGPAI